MSDTTTDGEGESGSTEAGTESIEAEANGIAARYAETDGERLLTFSTGGAEATVAQNAEGYAMLKVRAGPTGDELERYYGFDMALDHAAELLGVAVRDLPIPEAAADMGM
ncbi:DUF7111 family protein [Halorubrum sp. HHNYT27]|uniref:DUF7111 family protein n=1 Tax=Halorubrum sp. HHNYT27 TaxID=3402275 RepID=UPI003EB9B50F